MIKFIKALVLTVMLSFSTLPAYAGSVTIDVDSLSQEQIELITTKTKSLVAEQKEIASKATDTGIEATINKAKKAVETINAIDTTSWAGKGAAAGEAVVNFASKLGIAAADFATSGTGILITLGMLMYFFGYKLIAIAVFIAASITAYKIFGIIHGKPEEVLVSEKMSKDGSVSKKYKTKIMFRFRSCDHMAGALATAGILSLPALIILGQCIL